LPFRLARLHRLAGRFLAPIDCSKIPALDTDPGGEGASEKLTASAKSFSRLILKRRDFALTSMSHIHLRDEIRDLSIFPSLLMKANSQAVIQKYLLANTA
jgi:hypothetical protein